MDTFQLKVISSDRVFYEGRCKQLIIPAPDGQKGILPHHENMIIAVEIGELHLQDEEGNWITASVSKGFAEIMNNRVSVLVNTAESPEEIDVRRATEAKERAQEQLRQKQSIQEYYHSQAFKIYKAVPETKYIFNLELEDLNPEQECDCYHLEVAQKNRQWAFVSPIYVNRE